MPQINSLERAFTVLTYLLTSQQINQTVNQEPTCDKFDGALYANIETATISTRSFVDTLDEINNSISNIQKELQKQPETKPYKCADESLENLFCEDNRYSKNLVLIGRGHSLMSHDLYQKLLNGISCDEKCIDSETDFFIGKNNLMQLNRNKSFGLLFVYIDTDGMEHFHYVPTYQFDGKKLETTTAHSSMSNVSLKGLVNIQNIKSWKLYLRKK